MSGWAHLSPSMWVRQLLESSLGEGFLVLSGSSPSKPISLKTSPFQSCPNPPICTLPWAYWEERCLEDFFAPALHLSSGLVQSSLLLLWALGSRRGHWYSVFETPVPTTPSPLQIIPELQEKVKSASSNCLNRWSSHWRSEW